MPTSRLDPYRGHARPFVGALALCATAFLLHASALDNWWWNDDATILMHAASHPDASYFYRPTHWQDLIVSSYTPWLSAMFAIDHAIAPWNPAVQHAHGVLAIGLAATLLWIWLRRRSGDAVGFLVAMLFLWGAPVALVAQQLMTRHYAEGLLYLLVQLLCLDRALASGGRASVGWAIAAGIAAFIAMCAKEVYVPLVLLGLAWVPWRRLGLLAPTGVAIVGYLALRAYMLGTLVGGYQSRDELSRSGLEGLKHFVNIPGNLMQPAAGAWLLCLAALALAVVPITRAAGDPSIRAIPTSAVRCGYALALVCAPLVPLTAVTTFTIDDQRFYFAAWGVGLMGLGIALRRRIALAVVAVLAAALMVHPVRETVIKKVEASSAEFFAQGKAIMESPEGTVLWLTPAIANWYSDSVLQMRMQRDGTEVRLVSDWVATLGDEARPTTMKRFDPGARRMVEIDAETVALERRAWRGAVERGRSMTLDALIEYDRGSRTLTWRYELEGGPARGTDARFTAVLFEGGVFPMGPRGSFRTGDVTTACLVLRADTQDPQGQPIVVYSDVLRFQPTPAAEARPDVAIARYRGPAMMHEGPPGCSNRKEPRRAS
jgi:hypothetical protein